RKRNINSIYIKLSTFILTQYYRKVIPNLFENRTIQCIANLQKLILNLKHWFIVIAYLKTKNDRMGTCAKIKNLRIIIGDFKISPNRNCKLRIEINSTRNEHFILAICNIC